jgi:dihydropteroate synthase
MPYPEPLAFLHGRAARSAVATGQAHWLAGGPIAFCLLRHGEALRPATGLPALTARRPPFAGLPGPGPWVMGILNTTPDSFSDGGRHQDPEAALAAGHAMHAAGADIIDIGGESTRPGAAPVTPDQEQARILPAIEALARAGIPISVDTRHARTMRAALSAGARIVNDISALADPEAAETVARAGAPVILMHMRGTPQSMMDHARYADIAAEVTAELAARIAAARAAGIPLASIAVDPGIGFAKTHEQNIELLDRLAVLHHLGCHILAGVSRKRFIGHLADAPDAAGRTPGSLAAALAALDRGATLLRVHDVPETVQALRVWRGLRAA